MAFVCHVCSQCFRIGAPGGGEMAVLHTKAADPTVLGAWIAHVLATDQALHNVGYTEVHNAAQKAPG